MKITDKQRLDWLGKQDAAFITLGVNPHWTVRLDDSSSEIDGKTLRKAIDAAMKSRRPKPGGKR